MDRRVTALMRRPGDDTAVVARGASQLQNAPARRSLRGRDRGLSSRRQPMNIKREDVDRGKVDFSDIRSGRRLPPIHPGAILRDEFLDPLGIQRLPARQCAQGAALPDQRRRAGPAHGHDRHGAAARTLFWNVARILGQPAGALRSRRRGPDGPPQDRAGGHAARRIRIGSRMIVERKRRWPETNLRRSRPAKCRRRNASRRMVCRKARSRRRSGFRRTGSPGSPTTGGASRPTRRFGWACISATARSSG